MFYYVLATFAQILNNCIRLLKENKDRS